MANSCRDCPNYLDETETKRVFTRGKDLGAASCQLHGYVLGKPGLTDAAQQRVCESFAQACPNFGEVPSTKARSLASVVSPDPELLTNPPTTPDAIGSCRSCKNCTPDFVVQRELGWYLPLCAATGRLLTPSQQTAMPKTCLYAQASPTENGGRQDTDWGHLDNRYEEGFSFHATSGGATYKVDLDVTLVGPLDYETDKPVSDEEKTQGIRAWRKLTAPNGTDFTFLPCFDYRLMDLSPQEIDKIPKAGDDEAPEAYVDHQGLVPMCAVEMMELDETPCLIGDAGTGKTELWRHLAWLMGLPFERITITRSSEVDDLAGKWLLEDGETHYHDGRLPQAWSRPSVICLDEPNVGPDEVWQLIRPLTDNSKQLVLDQGRGEKRTRHPWCFFGMAMNPPWDHKYVGTNEISDADGNRLATISVGLPPEHVERAILGAACKRDGYEIPVETLDKIMQIASNLRAMIESGGLVVSWGIRPQIAVARKSRWYSLADCYRRAVCDRLEPQTAEMVLGVVRDFTTSS